jgi:hypothetical protein
VTLSHNDDGLEGRDCSSVRIPRNLFVLSQGGKGHIPLLLWLNILRPDNYPLRKSYRYDVCFMGTLTTHWVRGVMKRIVANGLPGSSIVSGGAWEDIYRESKFILTPRGWGRNSYRLAEVLQMGLIPVYVYTDIIWLPYYDSINWSGFSIVVQINDLNETLAMMKNCPASQVNEMRMKIHGFYKSHFTVDGHFVHIMNLLKGGFEHSDLRCSLYSHNRDGIWTYY